MNDETAWDDAAENVPGYDVSSSPAGMGVFKIPYQESPWTGGSHEKSSFHPGMISVNVAQVPRLRSVGKSFFDHMGGQIYVRFTGQARWQQRRRLEWPS